MTPDPAQSPAYRGMTYLDWVDATEAYENSQRARRLESLRDYPDTPKISIVTPVYKPALPFLEQAIQSIEQQIYTNWELCLVDDGSQDKELEEFLKSKSRLDARIKVFFRAHNGHICRASNDGLMLATGVFTGLFDHDDLLHPDALYWVFKAHCARPDAKLFFSDEDKIDLDGKRRDPHFKHVIDKHLLLGQNFVSHLGVYQTDMIRSLGGFRVGYEGSQDHDLALRCTVGLEEHEIVHIPRVLYHWRRWERSTASSHHQKDYAQNASLRAVNDHLKRVRAPLRARPLTVPGCMASTYEDGLKETRLCLIIKGTPGSNEEMNSTLDLVHRGMPHIVQIFTDMSKDALQAFEEILATRLEEKIPPCRPIPAVACLSPKNISGKHIGRDVDVMMFVEAGATWLPPLDILAPTSRRREEKNWALQVMSRLKMDRVGVVGGRVINPYGQVTHSGYVFGPEGIVHHRARGAKVNDPGYMGRNFVAQEVSAVGIDFMACCRDLWEDVGGFAPSMSPHLAAIDFCLRSKMRGKKVLLDPLLMMQAPNEKKSPWTASRGDLFYLLRNYKGYMRNDPHLSPNLQHLRNSMIVSPPDDKSRYATWAK